MSFPPPTEKQARMIWLAVTGLALALLVVLGVALIWGLGQVLNILAPVLWPLAVAGVLAYLLDPLVDFLEKRRVRRTRAIVCVFALAVVLLVSLLGSIVPQLVNEAHELAIRIPAYTQNLQKQMEGWLKNPPMTLQRFLGRPSGSFSNPAERAVGPRVSTPGTEPGTDPGASAEGGVATNSTAAATAAGTGAARPTAGDTNTPAASGGSSSVWANSLNKDALQTATDWAAKSLPKIGSWLAGQVSRVAAWFGVLAGLALIPVYAFYFLLEKQGIQTNWTDYLPVKKSEFKDELVFVLNSINDYLIVFFRSQVLVAICDGVLYTLGFWFIGLPYCVLLGVMAVGLTMIPFLGAMTVCATALILAVVQYGDMQHPALVLMVFGIVQTLEGLVISPKIMGDRVGLHPLSIIVAVMVGTTLLGGILGGLLAIPLTAAGRVIMFRYVWKKR